MYRMYELLRMGSPKLSIYPDNFEGFSFGITLTALKQDGVQHEPEKEAWLRDEGSGSLA